jgi:hypothetical protein
LARLLFLIGHRRVGPSLLRPGPKPADLTHVFPILAHDFAAFPACLTRFLTAEPVCDAARVRRFAA